jgi:hypothetical protein
MISWITGHLGPSANSSSYRANQASGSLPDTPSLGRSHPIALLRDRTSLSDSRIHNQIIRTTVSFCTVQFRTDRLGLRRIVADMLYDDHLRTLERETTRGRRSETWQETSMSCTGRCLRRPVFVLLSTRSGRGNCLLRRYIQKGYPVAYTWLWVFLASRVCIIFGP